MGRIKAHYEEMIEAGEDFEGPEFDGPAGEEPRELLDAEDRCPESKFVQSCRSFFEERGFLSAAQRRALTYTATPNRRRRQFGDWE